MQYEIEWSKKIFENIEIYAFLSVEHSATYALNVAEVFPEALGKYGSIVAIPTKGTAFFHPIELDDLQEAINKLSPVVHDFYRDDPAPITKNLYWYYNGKFEIFKDKDEDLIIPKQLVNLLR